VLIRFVTALLIIVHSAIAGSAIEGLILDERRALSRQHYRLDAARERVARLRIDAEKLGGPTRLMARFEEGRLEARPATAERADATPAGPLLRWRVLRGER
jgi:hypothetical protein